MSEVVRLDAPRRFSTTPQGGIRAGAYIGRAGVIVYRRGDGKVRREYTPPAVLEAALRSAQGAPITRGHPLTANGLLTPESYRTYALGTVDSPRMDSFYAAADLLVQDAETIAAVACGDLAEVSMGYLVALDETPGVTPAGEAYDAKRLSIRVNHVALIPPGRGREGPEVRIRLDAQDAIEIDSAELDAGQERQMKDVRLDGADYRVDDAAAPHLERAFGVLVGARDAAQAELGKTKKTLEETEGRLDSVTAERDELKTKLATATDPRALSERIATRVKLERDARAIVGDEVKLDSLSDDEIRRKAIEKRRPGVKLEGKGDGYVLGVFESLLESHATDARTDASEALDEPLGARSKGEGRKAYDRMVERHNKAASRDAGN